MSSPAAATKEMDWLDQLGAMAFPWRSRKNGRKQPNPVTDSATFTTPEARDYEAPSAPTTRRSSGGNGASPKPAFQIGQKLTLSQLESYL